LPEGFDAGGPKAPLVVSLHTWSFDCEQRNEALEAAVEKKGWVYLFPNFRGVNDRPPACGSPQAQQDILDAVQWTCTKYPIDRKRIYLTGVSGGGHMTMLMAGRHPKIWAAASAWVGISDLMTWHDLHRDDKYGRMVESCCSGAPYASLDVTTQYRDRSPIKWLAGAVSVPLDIAAGVHDGYTGSVPVRQSLNAFNVIAKAAGAETISEQEIVQISRPDGHLDNPKPQDQVEDAALGRKIYLRRTAAKSRVTIFEGGHEEIAPATVEWLGRHSKE
jgi:dipeptidyl aminopeptidase/acylaminoacyl peptidase